MSVPRIILGLFLLTLSSGCGALLNLGFEDFPFQDRPSEPSLASAKETLPHWVPTYGGHQQEIIGYNGGSIGGNAISVWGLKNGLRFRPAEGSVYALLQRDESPVHIAQRGLFPGKALAIEFYSFGNLPLVLVDEHILKLTSLGSKPASNDWDWQLYGADISQFAGGEHELKLAAPFDRSGFFLDGISFTNRVLPNIPEPSTGVFLFVAVGILVLNVRQARHHARGRALRLPSVPPVPGARS